MDKEKELAYNIARYLYAHYGGGGDFDEVRKHQSTYDEAAKFAIKAVREFDKNKK